MNLEELTKELSSKRKGACFFNSKRGSCLPAVENLDREIADVNIKITDRMRMMTLVRDSNLITMIILTN